MTRWSLAVHLKRKCGIGYCCDGGAKCLFIEIFLWMPHPKVLWLSTFTFDGWQRYSNNSSRILRKKEEKRTGWTTTTCNMRWENKGWRVTGKKMHSNTFSWITEQVEHKSLNPDQISLLYVCCGDLKYIAVEYESLVWRAIDNNVN
jgi:hypothetical protein